MCDVPSINVLTNIEVQRIARMCVRVCVDGRSEVPLPKYEQFLYDLIGTNIVVLLTGMSVMYYRLFVMM